jgi:tetratricopeptide (TPR) repeat protein
VTQAAAPPNVTAVIPPSQTQAVRSTPADLQTANVFLTGFNHIYQTWNNCGPATLSMNLSYYGIDVTQAQAAQFLKPNVEDKNVSPHELVAFAQSMGFNAIKRVNGSHQMLKSFLQAGIPVLIEKGFEPDATSGWEGHYELIIGHNDARSEFIAMDSYTGPNQSIPYDNLDWYWSHFNRTYIIVYTDAQADLVMNLLGADADATSNIAAALAAAQSEAAANPNNTFAWFNIGTNMADLGEYESAAAAYDQARSLDLPWRMTWYQFNIFEAYYHTARFDDVIALADATLARTPDLEELWYYRGLVHQARGQLDAAREQFNKALVYNPNFQPAVDALANL